jgi:hypothetical protein
VRCVSRVHCALSETDAACRRFVIHYRIANALAGIHAEHLANVGSGFDPLCGVNSRAYHDALEGSSLDAIRVA